MCSGTLIVIDRVPSMVKNFNKHFNSSGTHSLLHIPNPTSAEAITINLSSFNLSPQMIDLVQKKYGESLPQPILAKETLHVYANLRLPTG